MKGRSYLKRSWISPKLDIKLSNIHGKGIFTNSCILKDEIVVIWGGELFSSKDIQNGKAKDHSWVGIGNNLYLGSNISESSTIDDFMNHSCNCNIWMKDEVTLIASREINVGEELTADYALWLDKDDYVMRRICNCGYSKCRKNVTGKDWMQTEIQDQYKDHFSPFINEKIKNLNKYI